MGDLHDVDNYLCENLSSLTCEEQVHFFLVFLKCI